MWARQTSPRKALQWTSEVTLETDRSLPRGACSGTATCMPRSQEEGGLLESSFSKTDSLALQPILFEARCCSALSFSWLRTADAAHVFRENLFTCFLDQFREIELNREKVFPQWCMTLGGRGGLLATDPQLPARVELKPVSSCMCWGQELLRAGCSQ